MKHLALLVGLMLLIPVGWVSAQSPPCQPNQGTVGQSRQGAPRFDPTTETTITGTVREVQTFQGPGRRARGGLHILVAVGTDVVDVHLGPSAFLTRAGFTLAVGDTVTVTGFKTVVNDKPATIARIVKKGERSVVLRNEQGYPLWSGRNRPW